ncbi:hypothetical protein POV27_16170 [Aureisphaera galaxeae]|uniref:hypothetical protein n=1 Tax=Aureisphaera galaxeae TaxID=1538023 RepID=UPI0023506483|nr:hypothetical protein [Aureisphaera galaxeae]MDC8005596.1 hypothetical protein [Aureisphaera galaxeae]
MNKYVVAVFFIIFSLSKGYSQLDLSSYSFVVVPDKYEFQFENDQYKLNSLTKFLFNKYGFHAYFNKELPNVERCDGLWADVTRQSGFIWTKVNVVLRDCNGEVIYTSDEGKSKLKEYGKAYQEGIREAFQSIIALGVNQKEIREFDFTKDPPKQDVEEVTEEKKEETAVVEVKKELPKETLEKTAIRSNDSFYENNGKVFILKEKEEGFKLYELLDDQLTLKGQIEKVEEGMTFTDTSGNTFNCSFDDERNLVIATSFQEMVFRYQR